MADLKHFGILGMKWGVRKSEKVTNNKHPDRMKVDATSRKRDAKELSNDELKSIRDRANLEKSYNDYLKANAPKQSKGKEVTKNVLGKIGTGIAVGAGTAVGMYALRKVLGVVTRQPEIVDDIFGKGRRR